MNIPRTSCIWPLSCLIALLSIVVLPSCHPHKNQDIAPSFGNFEQMVNKIDILASNHPKSVNKVKIIDSLFEALKHPTANDLCEKYVLKCYYSKTYPDTEEMYADSALMVIRRKVPDDNISSNIYGRAFLSKASALRAQHKFTNAYKYYSDGIKSVEGTGDTALFLSDLGQISYDQGFFLTAAHYFGEQLTEDCIHNHTPGNFLVFYHIQGNLDNVGLCYDKAGMTDTAISYYNKALDYIGRHEMDFANHRKDAKMYINSYKGLIYGNLGTAYWHKGNLKEAEALFKKDISINNKKGYEPDDIHTTQLKLVDLYLRTSRIKEAGHLLDTVKMECDSTHENPYDGIEIRWCKLESDYYILRNQPQEAYSYASIYAARKDSADKVNTQLSNIDFNNLFNAIQGEESYAALKKNDDKQGINSVIAFFILTVLIATGVFVSRNNWRLKKLNTKIVTQNTELRKTLGALEQSQRENTRMLGMIVNDLHDPISNIMNTAALLLEEEHSTETRRKYLTRMKTSSTTLLEITTAMKFPKNVDG